MAIWFEGDTLRVSIPSNIGRVMKGNNTLELNEATVKVALQEYFDKRSTEPGFMWVESVELPQMSGVLKVRLSEGPQ